MNAEDVASFFAARGSLDAERFVELDYRFECSGDPRVAAAHLASEQSTAQWQRPGVAEDFRPRHAAKVIALETTESAAFSLAVRGATAGPVHVCRVTLAHPVENFGARIPNLLSAVLGEGVFFVPSVPIVRLEDIRFPASFLAQFEGPQFGIAGIRARLNAHGRPIFLGVIKPNLGLAPEAFAALGEEALRGGLDIVKDDELLADVPSSPLAERAKLLGAARARVERETGVPRMYLANVTDEVARLLPLHDLAVAAGADALLLNVMPVGLSALRMLRAHARVPIFAHFPLIAAMTRVPGFGVHTRVLTKLQRLAGADAVIMPGFGPRMMTDPGEVLENVRACLEPMGPLKPVLPVPGGSDSADTLAGVYRAVGHVDFGFVPGRGVFGHPGGPRAGAASIRQAWDALAAQSR